jgi:hypothetical protein
MENQLGLHFLDSQFLNSSRHLSYVALVG